jgi:hypothetical protein
MLPASAAKYLFRFAIVSGESAMLPKRSAMGVAPAAMLPIVSATWPASETMQPAFAAMVAGSAA